MYIYIYTYVYSPGLWPRGVLENGSVVFGLYPPTPQQGLWVPNVEGSGKAKLTQTPSGPRFFCFFSNVFFDLISGSVVHLKSSKNTSKIKPQSHYFTTLRRLVFRALFGKVKNQKIGVSSRPYAHFRGFRDSKFHSKNHQQTSQNV